MANDTDDDDDDDVLGISDEPFDISGELPEMEATRAKLTVTPVASARLQLEITDDEALEELADDLAEDETAEEWFTTELFAYLGDAIAARKLSYLDAASGALSLDLCAEATALANEAFEEYGVRVAGLSDLAIEAGEEDQARLDAQLGAEAIEDAQKG